MRIRFRPLALFALLSSLTLISDAQPVRATRVIQVTVGADGEMRFHPAAISAGPGDVIRFVAFAGVHNVHFPKESNAGAATLPPVSGWLLREGDSYELKVGLAPGVYHFQCDPHALMGMKGTLTVTG